MASEVKKAIETNAVIGHVAPLGISVVGYVDTGQGSSLLIRDWPKQHGVRGIRKFVLPTVISLQYDVHAIQTFYMNNTNNNKK